jgi:cytochrome c oxidase subunit 3
MSEPSTEAASGAKKKHPPPAEHVPHDDHDDHAHHEYPFLAHHFDTPQQQFEAGKLGIWLFLVTEVLFFAGLFCAYTIYRTQNPEVFVYAHYHLDTNMGAVNTTVLLVSSLTAAWAVRCAQKRQKSALMLNIVITIACAATFMVVKYFEYSHKAHEGVLWGKHFKPHHEPWQLDIFRQKHPEAADLAAKLAAKQKPEAKAEGAAGAPAATAPAAAGSAAPAGGVPAGSAPATAPAATTAAPPPEKLSEKAVRPLVDGGMLSPTGTLTRPPKAHIFFGIYFFMTGLHGLHVLIGIGIWIWMLFKASSGVFNENYFGPIDFTALYWHLVDLIWIYLFPLLYLIH